MKGSLYRYQAPKLQELSASTLDELTPVHRLKKPEANLLSRALVLNGDKFIIMTIVMAVISIALNLESEILGPYQSLNEQPSVLAILLVYSLPISFLVTIAYYSLNYYFNGSATPINRMRQTRIVPVKFVTDGSVTNFQLSLEQSLKRSLAHTINYMFFYLPNLVMLIDDHQRSFPDLFSQTVTVNDEDFMILFQVKGSPEYQVKIDIDTLEVTSGLEYQYSKVA